MPQIIMTRSSNKLDPSVKRKAYAFLEKLAHSDTSAGLHIERLRQCADDRVRTGRVDDFYRAVLFKIAGPGEPTYVFHGIWPHDDAIAMARKTTLSVNPVNGITEIRTVEPATDPAPVAAGREQGATTAARPTLLAAHGIQWAELVDGLGLDHDLARLALEAVTEDEILALAGEAISWQGLALIDLAAGHDVDEVRQRLDLDAAATGAGDGADDDDALLRGLDHAAAKLSFAYIENNEELRRAIEEGDFGAWRVFLHPEQRRYVTGSWNGPFRLSGGAGTGKTVVVVHRACHLARAHGRDGTPRVIVTTYTTNLAEAMKRDLARLDPHYPSAAAMGKPGIYVAGIDALAYRVLKSAGDAADAAAADVLGHGARVAGVQAGSQRWADVLDLYGDELPPELRSTAFFEAEYATVILPARIHTEQDYLTVRRPGRGVALDRARRRAVWHVVAAYRNAGALDRVLDFDETAAIAAAHLTAVCGQGEGFVADHVLVDEAQDLTPARWQFLRALAGPETRRDDLFIAEDSHQRIYGRKVVLSRHGIQIVGRSRRLTLNYRTTAQNLAFALEVLAPGRYTDLDDEQEKSSDYRSARSGPRPVVSGWDTLTAEYDNAAEVLRSWLQSGVAPETVAVLVRDRSLRDKVVAALGERGVGARAVDREAIRPGLAVVMTMHRAKGTEFSRVLLFGISKGSIPAALHVEKYSPDSWDDAMLRERSLVYVAATRARDALAVSWGGESSQFLCSASPPAPVPLSEQ